MFRRTVIKNVSSAVRSRTNGKIRRTATNCDENRIRSITSFYAFQNHHHCYCHHYCRCRSSSEALESLGSSTTALSSFSSIAQQHGPIPSSSSPWSFHSIHPQQQQQIRMLSSSTNNNDNNAKNSNHKDPNKFVVSILGPPNAGKSTLFNRLQCKTKNKAYKLGSARKRHQGRIASKFTSRGGAIVSPQANTTRDRRECYGRIGSTEFIIWDTAGVNGDRINLLSSSRRGGRSGKTRSKQRTKYTDDDAGDNTTYIEYSMMEQTLEAAKNSDLVLLMWDAKVGLTHDLVATVRWLRKLGKITTSSSSSGSSVNVGNVAILANKLEGDSWVYDGSPVLQNIEEVKRLLGLDDTDDDDFIIPISALQGEGMADIAIRIEQMKHAKKNRFLLEAEGDELSVGDDDDHNTTTPEANEEDQTIEKEEKKPLQIAVLGRPNVGKSTLVNSLLQDQRVLTGPTPGLTRDAIAIEWVWNYYDEDQEEEEESDSDFEDKNEKNNEDSELHEQPIQLVDTAGIRKLTKRMDDTIEDMAVADALRAMKVAEVAVLVLDAEAMFIQRQELAICNAIYEEGRAMVIAANKIDLLELNSEYTPDDFAIAVRQQIEERIPMLRNIPVVPMSCLSGYGVSDLLPVVKDARDRWSRTVSTGLLNRWLKEVVQGAPLPVIGGVPAKLKYIIQTKGRPPTFIIFANVSPLPETYLRYLTKHFQDSFQFFGMPVRMIVQQSSQSNPYDSNKRSNKKSGRGGEGRRRGGFGLGGKDARRQRKVKEYIVKRRQKKKDKH